MILLVTNKTDITTDFVVAALHAANAPFARFNTEDLLSQWRFTWRVDGWSARTRDRMIEAKDITSVYYRRPRPASPLDGTAHAAGDFVVRESEAFLKGLFSTMKCGWISSPTAIEAAEDKLRQLQLASKLGFMIPETLVTHDPEMARRFCTNRKAIVKPISSGLLSETEQLLAYCEELEPSAPFDDVALCPHLLQARVPKVADIRVTVVDETVFACRIASQLYDETALDWRRASSAGVSLKHEIFDLNHNTRQRCVDLVHALDLRFGAIDLVELTDGDVCFLEINPNGQWAWIEQRTGAPISASIARALTLTEMIASR